MRVEFLGTAGYHPSETRHTTGILVPDAAPGADFLLDGGSGTFRLIGRALAPRLHIFLSHAHLDHTFGLTFLFHVAHQYRQMHDNDLQLYFYGDAKTRDAVKEQLFAPLLFPLTFRWEWHEIEVSQQFEVAGVRVNTAPLTHPGGSLGFRFDWPDSSLGFVTDTARDERYYKLIEGVDLLIHERNFPDQFAEIAEASGHCTSSDLVAAARASGAKQVAAMHFNPMTITDPLEEDDVYSQIENVISSADGMILNFLIFNRWRGVGVALVETRATPTPRHRLIKLTL